MDRGGPTHSRAAFPSCFFRSPCQDFCFLFFSGFMYPEIGFPVEGARVSDLENQPASYCIGEGVDKGKLRKSVRCFWESILASPLSCPSSVVNIAENKRPLRTDQSRTAQRGRPDESRGFLLLSISERTGEALGSETFPRVNLSTAQQLGLARRGQRVLR